MTSKYELTLQTLDYDVNVESPKIALSLSRTGGQGAKGDTITSVFINAQNELVVVTTDSAGVESQFNAGAIESLSSINTLEDVTITNLENDQVLVYNSTTQVWENKPHTFATTSDLGDVDNTNRTDGSLLVFSSNSSKYEATSTLQNQNTIILGGSF